MDQTDEFAASLLIVRQAAIRSIINNSTFQGSPDAFIVQFTEARFLNPVLYLSACIRLYLRSMDAFDFTSNEKGRTKRLALCCHNVKRLLVLFGVINRAGDTDRGRFIKAIFFIVKRRRTQMQRAGHPVAEVTRFTLGVVRFVITDVANPGGSFHVVAAAHIRALQLST